VIQKQCFAIVGTRVPMIATPLSFFLHSVYRDQIFLGLRPYRNRILLEGPHQEVYRLISLGPHRIKVSQQSWQDDALTQRTYIDIGWLFSRQPSDMYYDMNNFLLSSSLPNGNLLGSMKDGSEAVGLCWARLDDGQAFERGYLEFKYLISAEGEFLLTYG
jgi:hypothetical protein